MAKIKTIEILSSPKNRKRLLAEQNFLRNSKLELDLVLSIMQSESYGYFNNSKNGETGTLNFCGQTLEISAKTYDAAYIIIETKRLFEKGDSEVIMQLKKVLVDSWMK